ncbi:MULTISPECIES: HAD family hydrolase [Atopobiaceae]|uniref:FMN phosphatase YigB, HAD superfamily n=1 Tax=Parafannyhessea umbonata TaxID=604330 RepID=A0A1H6JVA7_9ACTN|nr:MULTISPECIES: HAD family hydrolase [Atopobiaceae]SEH66588.1 FMN phosphatase YigB, HAD superfamily [Parafannyhessea umbonata]SJZ86110.1 FMN phosphatase YigB, HAD superfamily [Olsenella sp. KH1P3]
MIRAILFDLDDTLLDINLTAFITRYVTQKARIVGRITRTPSALVMAHMAKGYLDVSDPKREDGMTNLELFNSSYLRRTGVPLDDPIIADVLDYYEKNCLWGMKGSMVQARPREGARRTIERAQELGLTVALATNPTFTLDCDRVRMEWAEVADIGFARISHIANSTRSKPDARYYQEFISKLGFTPQECLMVGNDARRDFPRPDIALRTAYVGHAWPRRAIWRGSIGALGDALPQVISLLDASEGGTTNP